MMTLLQQGIAMYIYLCVVNSNVHVCVHSEYQFTCMGVHGMKGSKFLDQ